MCDEMDTIQEQQLQSCVLTASRKPNALSNCIQANTDRGNSMENQKNTVFEMTPPGRVNERTVGCSGDGMTFRHFPIASIRSLQDLTACEVKAGEATLADNFPLQVTYNHPEGSTRTGMGIGLVGVLSTLPPEVRVIVYDPNCTFPDDDRESQND